jgi:hypothetical protein
MVGDCLELDMRRKCLRKRIVGDVGKGVTASAKDFQLQACWVMPGLTVSWLGSYSVVQVPVVRQGDSS